MRQPVRTLNAAAQELQFDQKSSSRMPPTRSKRTTIVDTDPGQDDAIALLFALAASDRLDLLAITAVAGNLPLDLTSRNARIVREWANRPEVPVYAGCHKPLVRELVTAEHVHGKTGLDGVPLPESEGELAPGHAVDFLIKTLSAAPEHSVTLCTIGPLTNIATALIQAPNVKNGIEEIVMMGGAYFKRGNVTPVAEFNVYADPDAAAIVFQSGVPIIVFPLDVTYKALATPGRIERLKKLGNQAGKLIAQILASHERHDIEKFGLEDGPLHDPCVIGYVLNPSLFSGKRVNVAIETESELTIGETVVDWNEVTGRQPNALWINEIDSDGFYSLLTETVRRLP
jgi:purine nucleosidase